MADATQYMISLREVVEYIIKKNAIHEGMWTATLTFNMAAGVFGATPEQSFPGAVIVIPQIGIQRADPNTPNLATGITVDAAGINPPPRANKKK